MAEITNTPWHECYSNCFDLRDSEDENSKHNFDKEFHVSPFIGMDIEYDWRFQGPGEKKPKTSTPLSFEIGVSLFAGHTGDTAFTKMD